MDPLTALGLASNIIQLISFTSDLVSKGREIYKSADGALIEHMELETIAKSLQDLSADLPAQAKRGKSLTRTEKQLRGICEGCNEVSGELIEAIQRLKATGNHKRWNSFRQALNSVWKENQIDALSKRLEKYRNQLDTTLLVSLREQVQSDVQDSSKPRERARQEVEPEPWHAELIEALHQNNWQSKSQQDIAAFSLKLSAYTKEGGERLMKAHILEQLRFRSMGDRYERIEDAYAKTFNWIFQEESSAVDDPEIEGLAGENGEPIMGRGRGSPSARTESSKAAAGEINRSGDIKEKTSNPAWSSFVSWLKGEEGLYWITGKPGSGKSTLMKYLYKDPRTLEHLRSWSGSFPLVTAGFFFWNSGTVMQMSKMGLLRALLYESINRSFELVPILFPERWKSYELLGGDLHPWTWSELALAFKTVLSDKSQRFFFFIDGLDEFDGDCTEIVDFVHEHSERSNVKICVASRPWLVFEDAFQRLPSLRLEDLTAPDIHRFVSEKLRGSSMFINLEELQPQEAKHLIIEVTGKASGVFLWVRLVVLSLLEGLRDGDSITDLQDRLYLLPSGLEDLFSKILDRLNPSYFEQASKLFQLVRASDTPLTILGLAFAEDGFDKAIAAEVEPMSPEQAKYRAERMRRRLNSRCKGLLDAPMQEHVFAVEARVEYLHRTVKDFLNRPDIWEYILSGLPPPFDPDLSLFGATLLEIKTLRISEEFFFEIRDLFNHCITRSIKFESTKSGLHVKSLKELDRAATKLLGSSHPSGGTWLEVLIESTYKKHTSSLHWTIFTTHPHDSPWCSLFEFVVQYPLYFFIDHELKNGGNANSLIAGEYLLCIAAVSADLRLVEMLFNHGADPNFCGDDIALLTPWEYVLCIIQNTKVRGILYESSCKRQRATIPKTPGNEADILSIFLENNADPRIIVHGKSVEDTIKIAFLDWNQERTVELLRKVAVLKKTFKDPKKSPSKMKIFFKQLGRHGSKAT